MSHNSKVRAAQVHANYPNLRVNIFLYWLFTVWRKSKQQEKYSMNYDEFWRRFIDVDNMDVDYEMLLV